MTGNTSPVEQKQCSRCGEIHPIEMFARDARYSGGRVTWCGPCKKSYRASHYIANRAKALAQNGQWRAANKERVTASNAARYRADPVKHSRRVAEAKSRRQDYYRAQNARIRRERLKRDPSAKIRARISAQLYYCLKEQKGGQTSEDLLGYPVSELRLHLERQFRGGMSWANFGKWHIDHIIPMSSFGITGPDDPQLRKAWALTNLRPLWAQDNLSKSNKVTHLL